MSGDTTIQALKRLTYLPERNDAHNGHLIAGQEYYNVYFTGGTISGVNLTSSGINLTGVASPTYSAGKLVYDTDNQCLTFFNNDPNVSLQIGQEEWIRVINTTGSTIPNGAAVYISGSSGGMPTISLAIATAVATAGAIGLATENIANNAIGYVTILGLVNGLDTSAFTAGAVYVSAVTPGALTQTAPVAPNYRHRVGYVTNVSATVGKIHVTPTTSFIGNGTANQVFGMNTAGTAQELKTLAAGTGITITPTAGTLTFASSGVASITGTTNRITIGGTGTAPTVDISTSYVGQATITTLGTITTGTWNAGVIAGQYGGTGVNNSGKTITLGGNLTTSGAFASTFTMTNTTTVTFPTTGTLATLAGSEALTNKSVNGVTPSTAAGATNFLNGSGSYTSPRISTLDTTNMVWFQDQKTSGTAAQSLTAATANQRNLITTILNNISGVSLTSNQIVGLPAGTYYATGFGATNGATGSGQSRIFLYNVTDAANIANTYGPTLNNNAAAGFVSYFSGYFTIAATKTIELRHYVGTACSGGVASSIASVPEIYAELQLWKVA